MTRAMRRSSPARITVGATAPTAASSACRFFARPITRRWTARNGVSSRLRNCRYKGTVWATWDPAAPSFFEYLGEFRRYLDLSLDGWDGSDGDSEVLAGVQ